MFSPRPYFAGFVALIVLSAQFASAANPPVKLLEGVLVLRNGSTVKGKISPHGDGYLVAMAGGGEIRLSRQQVAYECRDMEEAFDLKSSEVVPGDLSGYVRLAYWCLREELMGHATRQFQIAHGIHPDHPSVQSLSRQLQIARERIKNASAVNPKPPTLRSNQSKDRPAGTPVSRATLEEFASVVQPLLINSCALAKCHGRRALTAYRVRRNPWRGAMTRPFTLKNLEATLQQVDKENPRLSPLLEFARLAHGPDRKPGQVQISSAQYTLVKDWVFRAAGVEIVQPRSFQTDKPMSVAPGKSESVLVPEVAENPVNSGLDEGAFKATPAATVMNPVPANSSSREAATLKKSSASDPSRDPFDPAWFNEKYSKNRVSALSTIE